MQSWCKTCMGSYTIFPWISARNLWKIAKFSPYLTFLSNFFALQLCSMPAPLVPSLSLPFLPLLCPPSLLFPQSSAKSRLSTFPSFPLPSTPFHFPFLCFWFPLLHFPFHFLSFLFLFFFLFSFLSFSFISFPFFSFPLDYLLLSLPCSVKVWFQTLIYTYFVNSLRI